MVSSTLQIPICASRETRGFCCISDDATLIDVGVTAYCDRPKQNVNLISLKLEQLLWKSPNYPSSFLQWIGRADDFILSKDRHGSIVDRWMEVINLFSFMCSLPGECLIVEGLHVVLYIGLNLINQDNCDISMRNIHLMLNYFIIA